MSDSSTFNKNNILVVFWAICVALLSVATVNTVPMIRVAENLLYDLRISYLSSANDQSNEIIIVGITEDTLSAMPYRSPIDRQFVSDLILELDNKGVKAIAVDILFDQPTEPMKDAVLRMTLGSTRAPVIVATAGKDNGLYPSQIEYQKEFLESIDRGSAVVVKDIVDGVVRAFPVYLSTNGTNQLGFAAKISRTIGIELPDQLILPIDFKRGPDADTPLFASYPAHAVHLLPREWFEGKIVLIGFELGFEDRHPTPLTRGRSSLEQLPGVQIHAQALAQLLDERSIIRTGTALTIAITVAFSFLGISLHLWVSKFRFQILVVGALLVLIWVGGIQLYVVNHTMIKLLPPTLALIASAIISLVQQWRTEQVKRQFVHRAFSKYMSADYVNHLVANPDKLKVGGEHREITFLFTDLSGFTTLTEKLEPELLVSLINVYLEKTCEIAIKHGGMVENIVGDALHVMFNAPMYHADHAQRAVAAAYELDTFCQSYSAHQRSLGIDFGHMCEFVVQKGASCFFVDWLFWFRGYFGFVMFGCFGWELFAGL